MAEEKARLYIREVSKEGIKTAFIYGNPKGSDVDLCIVSEKPEHLKAVPEGIDLKVLTPQEFEKRLAIFGKQAVEFR
jgi:predicted nucleotidyltransferase